MHIGSRFICACSRTERFPSGGRQILRRLILAEYLILLVPNNRRNFREMVRHDGFNHQRSRVTHLPVLALIFDEDLF